MEQDAGGNDDVGQFNKLVDQLEKMSSEFLSEAATLYPRGNLLYYITTDGMRATLHRYENSSKKTLKYKFSVGESTAISFRADSKLIVTMEWNGSKARYRAFEASEPERLVGTLEVDGPADGQRGWAYAVFGDDVFLLTTGDSWVLRRWRPRVGAALEEVFNLNEAGLTEPGELRDFDVEGNSLVFIESGRIWRVDLQAKKVKAGWLKNRFEVTDSIQFDEKGAYFVINRPTGKALMFSDFSKDGDPINLAYEIRHAPFKINETYATSHHYVKDGAHWGDWVLYTSSVGVFAFNRIAKRVVPVLLDSFHKEVAAPDDPDDKYDVSVTYDTPVVLEDGTLFVYSLYGGGRLTGGRIVTVEIKKMLSAAS